MTYVALAYSDAAPHPRSASHLFSGPEGDGASDRGGQQADAPLPVGQRHVDELLVVVGGEEAAADGEVDAADHVVLDEARERRAVLRHQVLAVSGDYNTRGVGQGDGRGE